MSDTGTVTSKGMVKIPARIGKKHRLGPGRKVASVESGEAVLLVPLLPLSELYGIDSEHREALLQGIRELEKERRREALSE